MLVEFVECSIGTYCFSLRQQLYTDVKHAGLAAIFVNIYIGRRASTCELWDMPPLNLSDSADLACSHSCIMVPQFPGAH